MINSKRQRGKYQHVRNIKLQFVCYPLNGECHSKVLIMLLKFSHNEIGLDNCCFCLELNTFPTFDCTHLSSKFQAGSQLCVIQGSAASAFSTVTYPTPPGRTAVFPIPYLVIVLMRESTPEASFWRPRARPAPPGLHRSGESSLMCWPVMPLWYSDRFFANYVNGL